VSNLLIGIDLGTSNSAVAYIDASNGADAPVLDLPVVQAVRPSDVRPQSLLPSALYLPHPGELPVEAYALPWDPAPPQIAGEFARWRGSKVPSRLITSAKSWLSHAGVDRTAPILPWGGPPDIEKMSPVEASSRLLLHIRHAWNHAHPEALLENLEVVITVPASFDEIARSLTVTAARRAGFEKFTLVEEPQAAFYDFTARHRHNLRAALQGVSLVLVVDVGGGTCDFTLVRVDDGERLRRIAVGDHLMLGGDNMDAAVARKAEEQMTAGGRKLTPTQWSELVQASRIAKESLLSSDAPENYHLSVVAEGGRLIGASMSAKISREDVVRIVLDGFFPRCDPGDVPRRTARVALQEFGLPYASDPAVTRQLAAFLQTHSAAGRPDAILLNGGVFNSSAIASRLVEVISGWWPGASHIRVLEHESLELAVARGAAWYGMVRQGMGRRIGGGAAHSFYVGLETKRTEAEDESKALCLIPRGHEEGQTVELGSRTFNLMLGRPVQFPLFTSTSDRIVSSGDIVTVSDDLHPLPPIHTVLKGAEGKTGQVPVHLRAILTEIGTLELWCVSDAADKPEGAAERWRLEFELRGSAAGSTRHTVIESMPPHFAEARRYIEETFATKPPGGAAVPVKVRQLWRNLEQVIGPREQWRVPMLREMWTALHARAGKRRRSADHERVWFQLAGYALRPGFGYPLDDWRCARMVESLFGSGVAFHKEKAVWMEFWIMWRRIAGGLIEERHADMWRFLKPQLESRLAASHAKPQSKKQPKPKGIQPEGLDEMVRLASALEHLDSTEKITLGDWIAPRVAVPGPWAWALGRVGARVPLYGSVHKTVDPDHASEWLNLLLDAHFRNVEGALFAIVQLARLTGDRSRDIDDSLRNRALDAVRRAHAPESWHRLLLEIVTMEAADQARAFGDTLPAGLAA
jgi:molecular chaperone DnaK (HSP70)